MRRICFGIVLGDLSRGRDGANNNHKYVIQTDLYLDLTRILSMPSLKQNYINLTFSPSEI